MEIQKKKINFGVEDVGGSFDNLIASVPMGLTITDGL